MEQGSFKALKIGDRVRDVNPACPRLGVVTQKPDPLAILVSWDGGTIDYIYIDDYRGMDDFGENMCNMIEKYDGVPLPAPTSGLFNSVPVNGAPYIRPLA